jgi:hypothetical protein
VTDSVRSNEKRTGIGTGTGNEMGWTMVRGRAIFFTFFGGLVREVRVKVSGWVGAWVSSFDMVGLREFSADNITPKYLRGVTFRRQ